MRETRRCSRLLFAVLVCAAAGAHAENTLQGLEMDVIEPGESAAHATARIVLPPPLALPDHEAGLDPEQRVRVDGIGESVRDSVIDVTGNPALAPEPGEPGEPGPGGGD